MFLEILIFNLVLLSLPVIGYFYGITQDIFMTDLSHMTVLIAALLVVSVIMSVFRASQKRYDNELIYFLRFLSKIYLFLGLIGTVVGLSVLVQYLHFSSSETASTAVGIILTGISSSLRTVFFATLLGLVAKVWTEANIYIFKRHEYKRIINETE